MNEKEDDLIQYSKTEGYGFDKVRILKYLNAFIAEKNKMSEEIWTIITVSN